MENVNLRRLPAEPGIKVTKQDPDRSPYVELQDNDEHLVTSYKSTIGALLYLAGMTHPNIS